MASSTVSARITLSTGPKTSVRASSLAGSTSARTVGCRKCPARSPATVALRPSTSGLAPAATPCAMRPSMRVWLSAEITGPISVPSSSAVADLARRGRVADLRRERLRRLGDGDDDRRRQAALAGAAERRVGDDLRRHVHVGVGQDDDRVLGAALALHALAVGGRAAVDVARHRRRADERDRAHLRMIEQRVDGVLAAVHQVDDAGREAGLLDELRRCGAIVIGVFSDGLRTTRVAAGDRVGQEPQRDHAGEVERRDDADDADRLADHQLVDARGDVLEVAAHASATGCRWRPRRSRCRACSSPSASASVLPHSCGDEPARSR